MAPMLSTLGGGSIGGFHLRGPRGGDKWYTDWGTGAPSFNLSGGSLVYQNSNACYSGGTDTFGYYGIFGFRDGHPLEVIDLDTGNLVYTFSDGTLNGANGYGVGMDSVRGYIYFCTYNNSTIHRLDLGSDFTGTTDGTKGTFNNNGGTRSSYTSQSWGWGHNDGIMHTYFPHDTAHPLHDKYIQFSRGNQSSVRIMNAGSSPTVVGIKSTSSTSSKHGTAFDWSSMSVVSCDRGNDVDFDFYNPGAGDFSSSNVNIDFGSYLPSASGFTWYSCEDAFIANNGDLIVCSGNATRLFWRYPRQ